MRGRKPKERDSYVLRMGDGTLVEVSREVYLEWYQSRRRERYQKEKDRKRGVYSLDELEEKGSSQGMPFLVRDGVEETALRNICRDNVQKALGKLPDADAGLMELLYFNGVTVAEKPYRTAGSAYWENCASFYVNRAYREDIFKYKYQIPLCDTVS